MSGGVKNKISDSKLNKLFLGAKIKLLGIGRRIINILYSNDVTFLFFWTEVLSNKLSFKEYRCLWDNNNSIGNYFIFYYNTLFVVKFDY